MKKNNDKFGQNFTTIGLNRAKHLGLAPVFGIVNGRCECRWINSVLGQGLFFLFICLMVINYGKKLIKNLANINYIRFFYSIYGGSQVSYGVPFPTYYVKPPHWFLPGNSFLNSYKISNFLFIDHCSLIIVPVPSWRKV